MSTTNGSNRRSDIPRDGPPAPPGFRLAPLALETGLAAARRGQRQSWLVGGYMGVHAGQEESYQHPRSARTGLCAAIRQRAKASDVRKEIVRLDFRSISRGKRLTEGSVDAWSS